MVTYKARTEAILIPDNEAACASDQRAPPVALHSVMHDITPEVLSISPTAPLEMRIIFSPASNTLSGSRLWTKPLVSGVTWYHPKKTKW